MFSILWHTFDMLNWLLANIKWLLSHMLCIGFVILWLFSCRNETTFDLIFMNLNLKIRNWFIFDFFQMVASTHYISTDFSYFFLPFSLNFHTNWYRIESETVYLLKSRLKYFSGFLLQAKNRKKNTPCNGSMKEILRQIIDQLVVANSS